MNDSSVKIIAKSLWGLIAVLGLVVTIWILSEGDPETNPDFNDAPIGLGIWIGYIATGLCAAAALIFGAVSIATNIKQKLPFLIAIASLAIVGFIAYAMSGDETIPYAAVEYGEKGGPGVTASVSKFSGFFLNFFYLLFGIAILTVAGTIVRDIMLKFKK